MNAEPIAERRKLVSVFGLINADGLSAEHSHPRFVAAQRQIVCGLPSDRDDETPWLFSVVDLGNRLKGDFVNVHGGTNTLKIVRVGDVIR